MDGGVGRRFECVSNARKLTFVKFISSFFGGEQGHTFGYLGRLDSGHNVYFHIFGQQRVDPELIYILIRREGVIWI